VITLPVRKLHHKSSVILSYYFASALLPWGCQQDLWRHAKISITCDMTFLIIDETFWDMSQYKRSQVRILPSKHFCPKSVSAFYMLQALLKTTCTSLMMFKVMIYETSVSSEWWLLHWIWPLMSWWTCSVSQSYLPSRWQLMSMKEQSIWLWMMNMVVNDGKWLIDGT
jgi:hypothetical protein